MSILNKCFMFLCVSMQFISSNAFTEVSLNHKVEPKMYLYLLASNDLPKALTLLTNFKIADFLGDEQKSLAEIAYHCNTDKESIDYILKFVTCYGIFHEVEDEVYENTELSHYLRADHPESMIGLAGLYKEWTLETSPREYLSKLYLPWVAQSIHAVVKLGIPDLLTDGPKTVSELSAITKTDTKLLHRLLSMLSDIGIFTEIEKGIFCLNKVGDFLQTNYPGSLAANDVFFEKQFMQAWPKITEALLSGKTIFELGGDKVGGYDYLKTDPEFVGKLNKYMEVKTNQLVDAVLEAFDFSKVRKLVDVGGGLGHLAKAIVSSYPEVFAIVYDLPEMISDAISRSEKDDRIEFVSGDIFDYIPTGGDTYILSAILHIFDENKCIEILKNCRSAMPEDAKLLIIEGLIPTSNTDSKTLMTLEDVKMGMVTGGEERTDAAYAELLEKAGFQVEDCRYLNVGISVIEATKIM